LIAGDVSDRTDRMTGMTTVDEHEARASALLATMRETPMIRSNPKHALKRLWDAMTAVFVGEAVLPRLARRVAMQLVGPLLRNVRL